MRKRDLICLMLSVIMAVGPYGMADTCDGEECYGESDWEGTGGSAESDCGICDSPGTNTWSRSLGGCSWTPFCSCTTSNYYTTASRTVTQNSVSAEQMAICDTAFENDLADLEALRNACIAVWATDCMIGCALFNVGYAACVGICSGGTAGGCQLAFSIDKAALQCTRSECKYSCSVSGYTYGGLTSGCIN